MYDVNIQASEGITEEEIANLKLLYITPVGSIPMERDKGIDISFLSMPNEVAKSLLKVEIIKKTRLYTEMEVATVEVHNDSNGKLIVKVVVQRGE